MSTAGVQRPYVQAHTGRMKSGNVPAHRYTTPSPIHRVDISQVADIPANSTVRLAASTVFAAGDLTLLTAKRVAVIGTREVSADGYKRASRIAKELAKASVVVVSGLAKGVDTAAHLGAIAAGGRTIAVLGTPLDKAYPAENAALQQTICVDHLAVSQFPLGAITYKSSFPERNKLMAALTHATVIIEASDTSGTLHQAAECVRVNRPLFILRSVVEDARIEWPKRFLRPSDPVFVLDRVEQVLEQLGV